MPCPRCESLDARTLGTGGPNGRGLALVDAARRRTMGAGLRIAPSAPSAGHVRLHGDPRLARSRATGPVTAQCASSQLAPTPTSATRGTLSEATLAMMR